LSPSLTSSLLWGARWTAARLARPSPFDPPASRGGYPQLAEPPLTPSNRLPDSGRLRVCVGVCVVACLLEWLSKAFVRVLPGRALSRDDRRGTGPPHGHRLKHQLVDSITVETVETHDKARGYEVGENRFLLVEDRDLNQARSERPPPGTVPLAESPRPAPASSAVRAADSGEAEEEQNLEEGAEEEEQEENAAPLVPRPLNTRTIEMERFVPAGQVDLRYLEKPYYVVPRDAIGQEAFAVIRDAMRYEKVDGLGRVVLARTPDACRGNGQWALRGDTALGA
jgi:ribosomal protein L12E/L44/L45/RPP1/RPP2